MLNLVKYKNHYCCHLLPYLQPSRISLFLKHTKIAKQTKTKTTTKKRKLEFLNYYETIIDPMFTS